MVLQNFSSQCSIKVRGKNYTGKKKKKEFSNSNQGGNEEECGMEDRRSGSCHTAPRAIIVVPLNPENQARRRAVSLSSSDRGVVESFVG